jgi:hypothetical protein
MKHSIYHLITGVLISFGLLFSNSLKACTTTVPATPIVGTCAYASDFTQSALCISNLELFAEAPGAFCSCAVENFTDLYDSIQYVAFVFAGTNDPIPGFDVWTPDSTATSEWNNEQSGNWSGFISEVIGGGLTAGTPVDLIIRGVLPVGYDSLTLDSVVRVTNIGLDEWDITTGTLAQTHNTLTNITSPTCIQQNDCFFGELDNGILGAKTKLRPADCGITLGVFNQFIYADNVCGVDAYQFRFSTSTDTSVYIRSDGQRKIKPSWMSDLLYATTYNVDVRVRVAGVWGNYGIICQVTTPATPELPELCATSCGATLTSMCDNICADCGYGAEAYQFRFDDGTNIYTYIRTGKVATIEAGWVSGLSINTTYTVDVRVKVEGTWRPYGNTCQLTTPMAPKTQISIAYCNTSVSSGTYVYADFLCGANSYQFRLTEQGNPTNVLYTTQTNNKFKPSWITGIANTTYDVAVRAKIGTWTDYGGSCAITITGVSAMEIQNPQAHRNESGEASLEAEGYLLLYPNPTAGFLTIGFDNTLLKSGTIHIYNLIGQEVDQHPISGVKNSIVLDITSLPKGTYVMRIRSGDEQWVRKLIKH